MGVMGIHQRMAELWTVMQRRQLTDSEAIELHQCHKANAAICWKQAYLENMSLLASMTSDTDWQHEICLEIDQMENPVKKKKPGRKGTDKNKE